MARDSAKYVEVDYDFAAEYPSIYHDDAALATWLRLLMLAHGVWPAPATLPRSVGRRPLKLLQQEGVIEITGDVYRVLGLDKRRTGRRAHAAHAADVRYERERLRQLLREQSKGIAPSSANGSAPSTATGTADAHARAVLHNTTQNRREK